MGRRGAGEAGGHPGGPGEGGAGAAGAGAAAPPILHTHHSVQFPIIFLVEVQVVYRCLSHQHCSKNISYVLSWGCIGFGLK